MLEHSKDQGPWQETQATNKLIRDFLSNWYNNVYDDRQLLAVLDELGEIIDPIPTTEPLILEEIASSLNASKNLSPQAKELIPHVISTFQKVEQGENVQIPEENRAYKRALLKEVDAYDAELYDTYHNEENNHDTDRSYILDLIYRISDEEQDDFAFIERRAETWPSIIRPRVIERAKTEGKFVGNNLEEIVDEVLPEIHRRTLRRIKGAQTAP